MEFTDKHIKALEPRASPYRHWEKAGDPGFHVQVSPRGTRTFYLFYRHVGRRRFLNLGRYPRTSLAAARRRARQARSLIDEGLDPQEHRKAELERQRHLRLDPERERWERERKGSVAQLFDAYCRTLQAAGKRSHVEARRALERDALPMLGEHTKANEVQARDVRLVLTGVIDRGALVQANRLRSWLRAAFQFGIRYDADPTNAQGSLRFFLEWNPVRDVPKPQERERRGERELSTSEIHNLWHALFVSELSKPVQIALKLVLTTAGQRIGELLGASWAEFDLEQRLWRIPGGRTRNGRIHLVPIGDMSLQLLRELQAFYSNQQLLFPNSVDGGRPMPPTSLSRAVARHCARSGFGKFTPRDLRRSCTAGLREIGVPAHVREALHNRSSDLSGDHATPYDNLPDKIGAMRSWDGHLGAIVSGRTHNLLETTRDVYAIG